MSRFVRKIALMDDETGAGIPEGDEVREVDLTAENTEAATEVEELETSAGEGEAEAEGTAEAVEVAEALESLAIRIHAAQENGGMTKDAAGFAMEHYQYLMKRVGAGKRAETGLSLESFGGSASRLSSTRVALESVTASLKELWKRIIKTIKDIGNWVREHMTKLLKSTTRLKDAAEKLKTQAESLKNDKATCDDSKGIDNAAVCKKVTFDNGAKPGDYKIVKDLAEDMVKGVPELLKAAKTFVDTASDAVRDANSSGTGPITSEAERKKLGEAMLKVVGNTGKKSKSQVNAAGSVYNNSITTVELPGNESITMIEPDASNPHDDFSMKLTASLKASSVIKTLPVMSLEDIIALCKDIGATADKFKDFEKEETKFREFESSVAKHAETMENFTSTDSDLEKAGKINAGIKKLSKIYTGIVPQMLRMPSVTFTYCHGASHAYLQWAQVSASRYSKSSKK